jgi:hypothetical protein
MHVLGVCVYKCSVQSSGISEVRIENVVTQDLDNQEEVGAKDEEEQGHPLTDPCEDQPHHQVHW